MAAATARPISITTPLGTDVLLLVGFTGHEAISQLFSFQLDLVAESRKEIAFDKLLGEPVAIQLALAEGKTRAFFGICKRISQGDSDGTYTNYRMEVVPQFWLLTRRAQSRIFQHLSVPDILKKVMDGLDVAFELQGTFQPRDFCVQYRETDFNFACRVMEEEGIYYFFKHTEDGHKMVVANTPQSHPDTPEHTKIEYEAVVVGGVREDRIFTWEKMQEIRSGKYTLWDHCFELPHKHLEVDEAIQDSVQVGKVTHKLKVANNDVLEIYDFPGEYAQRFDGIDKGGGEQPAELQKIFQDNKRTVAIRMQQEAVAGLAVSGTSTCRHLVSGHKFTLEKHGSGDGEYLCTVVQHSARSMDFRSADPKEFTYQNSFSCIPMAIPFRPQRNTPKPFVQGSQTAVVVGPAGEEIFCDKYGRIKVQFHWDRQGKYDADSSCWLRVGTIWAGKTWGITNVPRIGQEVIVDFLEGDPDQPIVIGSVHNADQMPSGNLPADKMVSGLKSNSTPKGGGYNGLIFNDTKGKEGITLHGQKNMDTTIRNDETHHVINNRTITVDGTHTETVKKATKITISEGPHSLAVLAGTQSTFVKGAVDISYLDKLDMGVKGPVAETFLDSQATTVTKAISIDSTTADVTIHAATQVKLFSGKASITLFASGDIEISGVNVTISGTATTKIGTGAQSFSSDTSAASVSGSNCNVGGDGTGKCEVKAGVIKLN